MSGEGVRGVAASMRANSERAAQAGTALAGLGAGLPPPPAGLGLSAALDGFSTGWTDVLNDVVAGLSQLATWMDDAVAVTVAADGAADQAFRGIPR